MPNVKGSILTEPILNYGITLAIDLNYLNSQDQNYFILTFKVIPVNYSIVRLFKDLSSEQP
jgi:hypothetical protein